MKNGNTYIRDSSHSLERIKNIRSTPDNAMLITADVVGLHPNIPHSVGLNYLKKPLKTELTNKCIQVI